MPLESIRNLVKPDLIAADDFILNELKSDIPLINELIDYILKAGGKRIRPLLVLLTARAFDHQDNQHIDLAVAIELIHTATLLHDDVVDHAELRRGIKTANAVWGNQASVLVGDFLYSRAFQLIVKLNRPEIFNIFAAATNLIAEGEVMQLMNAHNPDTTEAAYFEVINRKTAKLFEVAAATGVALSTHHSDDMTMMKQFGSHFGTAYQLIDDVLDYDADSEETGKAIGNDLSEGKPTLPLIYAMRVGSTAEADLVRQAIKQGNTERLDDIMTIIQSTKAIEYTAGAAKQFAALAMKSLTSIHDSPYRNALGDLTQFVVERQS